MFRTDKITVQRSWLEVRNVHGRMVEYFQAAEPKSFDTTAQADEAMNAWIADLGWLPHGAYGWTVARPGRQLSGDAERLSTPDEARRHIADLRAQIAELPHGTLVRHVDDVLGSPPTSTAREPGTDQ